MGPNQTRPDSRLTTLVLNAGSSSLKFALFSAADPSEQQAQGIVRRVGSGQAILEVEAAGHDDRRESIVSPDHRAAFQSVVGALTSLMPGWESELRAIGHR